ncbi:DM13 domain-containing protein [Streptomyces erythrochromogenes]
MVHEPAPRAARRPTAAAALTDYSNVTIWCDRFDVSFGAAQLQSV